MAKLYNLTLCNLLSNTIGDVIVSLTRCTGIYMAKLYNLSLYHKSKPFDITTSSDYKFHLMPSDDNNKLTVDRFHSDSAESDIVPSFWVILLGAICVRA